MNRQHRQEEKGRLGSFSFSLSSASLSVLSHVSFSERIGDARAELCLDGCQRTIRLKRRPQF